MMARYVKTPRTEIVDYRSHQQRLALASGWVPETIRSITRIGRKCTLVLDAIRDGTFESSGLADKILHRTYMPAPVPIPDDPANVYIPIDARIEAYDRDIDPETGHEIDLRGSIATLPVLSAVPVLERK